MLEFPAILLALAALLLLPMALVFALRFVFRLIGGALGLVGTVVGRVFHLGRGFLVDGLHAVGSGLTAGAMLPLTVGNLAVGRPRAAREYGGALRNELGNLGGSLYRLAIGHPARFFGLQSVTEGLERRLPEAMEQARRSEQDQPRMTPKAAFAAFRTTAKKPKEPAFEGFRLVDELPAGGSGARLYLAEPDDERRALWRARGTEDPGQVVIKAFDLEQGSTLPQIVRENRALVAARRLGLVLDHELEDGRFHYVMPYVPGEDLDVAAQALHEACGPQGLDDAALRRVLGFSCDLAATLGRFHREGLWHKDVKPSNLIVSRDRLHVVDLGLVTPLASSLTLTTHGTEYYRDPEMVRLAMRGVKVHEVDGVKFDIYSTGAVLYSMVENSFPAHGSLSRLSKRCPDALGWIIRRCMADLATRYRSADELGRDLAFLLAAKNPFAVLPADLPSLGRTKSTALPPVPPAHPRRPAPSRSTRHESLPREEAPTKEPRRGRQVVRVAFLTSGALLTAALLAARQGHGHDHARAYGQRVAHAEALTEALRARSSGPAQARRAMARPAPQPSQPTQLTEPVAVPKPQELPRSLAEALRDRPGDLLVVRTGATDGSTTGLEHLVPAFERQDRRVLGLGDTLEHLNLEAEALAAVGLAPGGDPEAARALSAVVARRQDLAGILWTYPDRGGSGGQVVQLVVAP